MQQWNLDIQRELPGNMVVDAAYVGNHGLKLPVNENVDSLNTAFYGAIGDSNRVAQLNALVPNPFSGHRSRLEPFLLAQSKIGRAHV